MKKEKQKIQPEAAETQETVEKQLETDTQETAGTQAGDQAQPDAEQPADNAENTEAETAEPPPEEALKRLAAAYAELEKANQQMKTVKQDMESRLTRLQADFDNFRRRTRAEKEGWQRDTIAAFCGELLPVIDNFGRALQALKAIETETGQASGHLAGVEMIARQLAEFLAAKGVERIPAIGEDFDPNWHEAIGQTPVEDEALVGKVTEEIQAGYRIGDKVLRASMVHVGAKQDV